MCMAVSGSVVWSLGLRTNRTGVGGVSTDPHKVPRVYITLEYDNKIVYNFLKLKM